MSPTPPPKTLQNPKVRCHSKLRSRSFAFFSGCGFASRAAATPTNRAVKLIV
jgi:hypothetical protein